MIPVPFEPTRGLRGLYEEDDGVDGDVMDPQGQLLSKEDRQRFAAGKQPTAKPSGSKVVDNTSPCMCSATRGGGFV